MLCGFNRMLIQCVTFQMELDKKTEKIYHLELQLEKSKSLIIELESQVASTSRQLQ